jgi:hypothetical protein
MSLRFAAAHDPVRTIGRYAAGRGLVARAQRHAANDNRTAGRVTFDPLLTDALRHFAAHGLDAPKAALAEAELAQAVGNDPALQHWLGITALFDRRLAATAQRELGSI